MKFILFAGFAATFISITVSALDQLRVVNVTSTTCTLFWINPINYQELFKYIISIYDNGFEYIHDKYYSSHHEVEFMIKNLQPGTKYNISVNIEYFEDKMLTECITKPEIDVAVQPIRQLEALDSTYTTCKISWKKPTKDNEIIRYVISAFDYQSSYTSYRYLSSHSDIQYTVEDLLPGTKYNISVYVDYKDNEVTTSCITKPQLGKLHQLDVTNTSCSVYWKKPVDNYKTLKYVVGIAEKESVDLALDPKDNKKMITRYFNFIPELLFTFINLQPATKYKISVYDNYTNKEMSTECLTKPNLGQLKVLDVTSTTCTLYWKKPIDNDEIIKYFITVLDFKQSPSVYDHFTSLPEIKYVVKKLEADTKYFILVENHVLKKEILAKCITKPLLDDEYDEPLEKYAYQIS